MDSKRVFPYDGCIYDRMFSSFALFLRVDHARMLPQVYGQILNLVPLKWAIIPSVVIFELGSLLCAVAFNVRVPISSYILGRILSVS
jgi:hypothetical protein